MRRPLALLLLFTGCLEPSGKPYLSPADQIPPTVERTIPAALASGLDTVDVNGPLIIVFSEQMEERSLRPGISVRRNVTEVPIEVFIEGDGGIPEGPRTQSPIDRPYAVAVKRAEGVPWVDGVEYTLRVLPTVTDLAGNPLGQELDVKFQAAIQAAPDAGRATDGGSDGG